MNVKDLVKELVSEINSLRIDLDCANFKNEKLNDENFRLKADIKLLEAENKELKEKVEDLEF